MTPTTRLMRSLVLAPLAVPLVACSDEPEDPGPAAESSATVAETPSRTGEVQRLEREMLAGEVRDLVSAGETDLTVTCAGDLPGYVGGRQTCTAVVGTERTGLLIEVTAVEGEHIAWEHTPFVFEGDLESSLQSNIRGQGVEVTSVDCPDDLTGEVGTEMTCSLEGDFSGAEVEVTEVKRLRVHFGFTTVS